MHSIRGITILHEDRDVLVVNKAEGILTEATKKHELFTAENALNNYIRKGQQRSSKHLFLVHRLDRETSGILLFAKNEVAAEYLKSVWHSKVSKTYLAATWGTPSPNAGTLSSYLYEDHDLFVRNIPIDQIKKIPPAIAAHAKFSQTSYKTISTNNRMALLEVHLQTGRRNQIRVQFAAINHPLVGDPKYGKNAPPFKGRMLLHASSLSFPHPHTQKPLSFIAPTPSLFYKLFPSAQL